jgi:hypothetical protein
MVQGSILGSILYTIFVSSLFNVVPLIYLAHHSQDIKSSLNKDLLVKDMEKLLEAITKWLKKSGLKVKQEKINFAYSTNWTLLQFNLKLELIQKPKREKSLY